MAQARATRQLCALTLRSQPDGLLQTLLATQFVVADTDSADVARRR